MAGRTGVGACRAELRRSLHRQRRRHHRRRLRGSRRRGELRCAPATWRRDWTPSAADISWEGTVRFPGFVCASPASRDPTTIGASTRHPTRPTDVLGRTRGGVVLQQRRRRDRKPPAGTVEAGRSPRIGRRAIFPTGLRPAAPPEGLSAPPLNPSDCPAAGSNRRRPRRSPPRTPHSPAPSPRRRHGSDDHPAGSARPPHRRRPRRAPRRARRRVRPAPPP